MATGVGIGNSPIFFHNGIEGALTYAEILRDTYGASEIWPLVNIASGTTMPAFINSARNGTESGWTLQNASGPVTGTLAPLSHGSPATDYGNVTSANHISIFDGDDMSLIIWVNISNWTPLQHVWRLNGSGEDITLAIQAGNVLFRRFGGGGTKQIVYASGSPTGWQMFGLSATVGGNALKGYRNGIQVGTTQTGLLAWATPLVTGLIGNIGVASAAPVIGHMAYGALVYGSIWSDANMLGIYNDAFTADPD